MALKSDSFANSKKQNKESPLANQSRDETSTYVSIGHIFLILRQFLSTFSIQVAGYDPYNIAFVTNKKKRVSRV